MSGVPSFGRAGPGLVFLKLSTESFWARRKGPDWGRIDLRALPPAMKASRSHHSRVHKLREIRYFNILRQGMFRYIGRDIKPLQI